MYSLDLANRGLVVGVNSEKVGEGSKRDESWESFFRGIFLSIYRRIKVGGGEKEGLPSEILCVEMDEEGRGERER